MGELKMYAGQDLDDAYRLMKDYSRRTGEVYFVNLKSCKTLSNSGIRHMQKEF